MKLSQKSSSQLLSTAASLVVLSLLALSSRSTAEISTLDPAEPAKAESPKTGVTLRDLLNTWFPGRTGENGTESESEDREAAPAGLESDASDLLTPQELLTEEEIRRALPWQPPNYSGQTGAIGYSEGLFETPAAFKERVAFWRDIYTKYTSEQGVIHDKDFVNIVFETVDFASIMSDKSKTVFQKARARQKLVDQRKKEIVERLKRLSTLANSDGLTGEDLRIWKLYDSINDPDRFKKATEKNRLRFQLGQRDRFIVGIYHSGRYLREMEKIFREENVPVELTRLPFVESSFNLKARSKVGASGIWQFMRRTARPFMKVGKEVDERNDPLKSTRASARLLKQNYQMLQSWPLAITGYNHGPYGVRAITNKLGTRDLGEIINRYSSKRFGFASENFYACFLAALDAERNAKLYFGDVKWGPEVDGVELKLKKPLSYQTVLQFFDGDENAAELVNSHVLSRAKKGKTMLPAGTFIRVPTARAEVARDFLNGKTPLPKVLLALKEIPLTQPSAQVVAPQPPPAPSASDRAPGPMPLAPAATPVSNDSSLQLMSGDDKP